MTFKLAPLLAREGLKLGHYVGEFITPGIGYVLKEAGADFVFMDMEHSGASFETVNRGLRYFEAAGVPVIVRVPSHDSHHIARVLDVGAEGVVVPMIGSVDEARSVLDRMKYTPQGGRGLSLGIGNDRYRFGPVAGALRDANARTCFIAMIESVDGVENVEAIAALEGVDVIWLGHADLSASMGRPGEYDHPDFARAVDRVLAAGRAHGKGLGRVVGDVSSGIALAAEGWDMIVYQSDTALLQTALRLGLEGIRDGAVPAPAWGDRP